MIYNFIMEIYDKYLSLFLSTAKAREELNDAIRDLGIPDLYVYDQRYTVLWLLAEIATRKKGFFVSKDLKEETNLSDKSVERFINFLVKKDFYNVKRGNDKRMKLYYPTSHLHKHIMKTWLVRTSQSKALVEFGYDNLSGGQYFKNLKKYPFPNNQDSFLK